MPIQRLSEQTLGLIGFGFISRAVASRAIALGMQVLAYSRHPDRNLGDRLGVRFADLEELLQQSDYVSLHTPLTEKTRHFMNGERNRFDEAGGRTREHSQGCTRE